MRISVSCHLYYACIYHTSVTKSLTEKSVSDFLFLLNKIIYQVKGFSFLGLSISIEQLCLRMRE